MGIFLIVLSIVAAFVFFVGFVFLMNYVLLFSAIEEDNESILEEDDG